MGEATVPAEQPASGQAARVPAPDVDAGGPGDPQVPPGQGSRPPVRLIWRVRDQATFAQIRHARRVRRGLITVARVDDGAPGPPRVAFGIGRKVGPAVLRNRLRRRLRELARSSALGSGAWFVSAAPGAGEVPFETLAAWWAEAVAATGGAAATAGVGAVAATGGVGKLGAIGKRPS
jgi:ribonuclease P protein component